MVSKGMGAALAAVALCSAVVLVALGSALPGIRRRLLLGRDEELPAAVDAHVYTDSFSSSAAFHLRQGNSSEGGTAAWYAAYGGELRAIKGQLRDSCRAFPDACTWGTLELELLYLQIRARKPQLVWMEECEGGPALLAALHALKTNALPAKLSGERPKLGYIVTWSTVTDRLARIAMRVPAELKPYWIPQHGTFKAFAEKVAATPVAAGGDFVILSSGDTDHALWAVGTLMTSLDHRTAFVLRGLHGPRPAPYAPGGAEMVFASYLAFQPGVCDVFSAAKAFDAGGHRALLEQRGRHFACGDACGAGLRVASTLDDEPNPALFLSLACDLPPGKSPAISRGSMVSTRQ